MVASRLTLSCFFPGGTNREQVLTGRRRVTRAPAGVGLIQYGSSRRRFAAAVVERTTS